MLPVPTPNSRIISQAKAPTDNQSFPYPTSEKRWSVGRRFSEVSRQVVARPVDTFHEQAQAPATEPELAPAGWPVPLSPEVSTERN